MTTFGEAVARLIENLWASLRGGTTLGFRPKAVSALWADEYGSLLFGSIEQHSTGRKLVYSSADMGAQDGLEGGWDFVMLPAIVDGTEFTPSAFLGFGSALARFN